MRTWSARGAIALGSLVLVACTEQVVVRPEGEFSWEPPSRLAWPIQGAVVSGFGDAARPSHQGIDLAARADEPVAAAMLGRVDFAGQISGYGNVIVLTHADQLSTVYAHLGSEQVQLGETVSRGQTIGTIGKDGYLHYEIRKAKQAVNPADYYEIAPQPLVRGSAEVQQKVAREPAGVGMLTGIDEEIAPPPPPTPSPTRPAAPTPSRRAEADAGFDPNRIPETSKTREPPPTPRPEPTRAPRRETRAAVEPTPRPTFAPEPIAEPTPEPVAGERASFGLGLAVVGANLFYVPAKLAYAGIGGVTGTIALLLAHDTTVANDIWTPSLGGDYVITAEHLRGNAPLRFAGAD